MKKSNIMEGTYEKKLKNVTNMRILYFFIFKFTAFYISIYILQKVINSFLFNWVDFESIFGVNLCQVKFGHFFIFKILLITSVIDLLKGIYFQKYEEVFTIRDYFAKLAFFPGYNLFFLFGNTIFSIIFFSQMEFSLTDKDYKKGDSMLRYIFNLKSLFFFNLY